MDKNFLKNLLLAVSPSGYEGSASNVFSDYMNMFATIVKRDNAGNTIFRMGNPEAKAKLMLSAHIDEIALQIQHIDDKGFLHFVSDGGVDKKVLPGSHVKILSANGIIDGVIGKAPIHVEHSEDRDKAIKIKDMKIDIGTETKEESAALVSVGDIALVHTEPVNLGINRIAGRGLDDKAGIFVIGEVAALLSKENLDNICVYFVACTQEETTATGAIVASAGINPTYSIDFDVTFATDDELVSANEWGDIKLGKGGAIAYGVNNCPYLTKLIKKICIDNEIPFQELVAPAWGTNTVYIRQSSSDCMTQLLSIPNRNMHTQAEVCDYRDLESLINMTAKTVLALNSINSV
jgi:endoglucanase